jgi:hypothetical protein
MENDKGKKRQRNSISSTSSAQNSKKAKLGSATLESPDGQREREIAQKKFEDERDAVLASIPESYRALFGQIGFYPWSKSLLPVLIVSPYDVPPEPVRKQWLEMFNKVSFNATLWIFDRWVRCALWDSLLIFVAPAFRRRDRTH